MTVIAHPERLKVTGPSVLFSAGFRPFFLLAAADAMANMAVWLMTLARPELWPSSALPAVWWHAHEMLFGFIAAAIGGFLLTAVPNWTGGAPYRGAPLNLLIVVWLCGRLAMLPIFPVPATLRILADISFYPLLAVMLAMPLIRAGKLRNVAFLVLLGGLATADLLFQLGSAGVLEMGEHIGLQLGADIVTIMIVVIGGRILPAFTRNWLAQRGVPAQIASHPWIERLAVISILSMFAADMTMPMTKPDGLVTLIAAAIQILRLGQWQGYRAARNPLLWVLHLGYAWLTLALTLKAFSLLFAWDWAANWLHALTVGAFSTMILAVMSRASLGHTGRPLVAAPLTVLGYCLLNLAGAVRVFGPVLLPSSFEAVIDLAGSLFIASFALFLWVYGPILLGPRGDGRPA